MQVKYKTSCGLTGEGHLVGVKNDLAQIYIKDQTGAYSISLPVSDLLNYSANKSFEVEEISKPKRYNKTGKLECWDVILDQNMNFLEGSILKYLWRYKEKNGIHDLEKAKVYIDKIITEIKKRGN